MAELRAMVLAAGLAERMRPLTEHCPKPLLPIANRPVMGYVLEHLGRHGFREVVANVHYRPQEIVDGFGNGAAYGVDLSFSYEEELLGPAGAVRRCKDFLEGDTFLVTGADDLTDMDLTAFLEAHRRAGAVASIGLVEVEETSQYGIVVTDEHGRIERFVEKPKGEPPSRTANTQIYLFEPEVFDFIPPDRPYDFGFDAFPAMVEAGVPFYGFRLDGYWRDIGSLSDYLDAHVDIMEGRFDASVPGQQERPGIWLGEGCEIADGVELIGPAVIGSRCRIEEETEVGGATAVGDGGVIRFGARVWNCAVFAGSEVPAVAKLERAVVTAAGIFRH